MSSRHFSLGLYAALAVGILDQLSKWWVYAYALIDVRKAYVTSFFNLVLSWNRGVTFGLFNEHQEWQPYVFTGIAVLIVLYLVHWLWRVSTLPSALGIGLIMGGAIGNIIDRIRLGAVMDFLDFHIGSYHWYAFNLADSAIVCGVSLLLVEHIITTQKKDRT